MKDKQLHPEHESDQEEVEKEKVQNSKDGDQHQQTVEIDGEDQAQVHVLDKDDSGAPRLRGLPLPIVFADPQLGLRDELPPHFPIMDP